LRIVIDTYAWIEFFIGSEKGKKVKEIMVESRDIFVPDIVLAEIARKYLREGMDENTVKQRIEWVTDIARNVSISEKIALLSGRTYLELLEKSKKEKISKPGLADGIVLAVTKALDAKVVTGDKHFKGLKEVIWVGD
jgi:predicted nucleic acid-binding protein